LFVFLTQLLEIERNAVLVRIVETALWTSIIYAVLLAFNVVVFENAAKESWRSRAPKLFQDLIRVLLVVIGAAIVLSVVWRQDLGGLVAALGVGSIVLGLALQETLGNLMSGIALFFERPFSVGDFISVGAKSGVVVQVSWRSVHLRTVERNLLVLPNSALGRETITNYSQPTQRQMLRLSFSFGLDAAPNRVKEALLAVARETPHVIQEPPPRVVAREQLADRIRYEARLALEHGRYIVDVVDHFTSAVWYAAQRSGIPLPLPRAVELQVHEAGDDGADSRQGLLVRLRRAEGFNALPEASIAPLAAAAHSVLFGTGEHLIEAGQVPRYVYAITSGEALGAFPRESNELGTIRFGINDVLGVIALARAQPSELQIVAATDLTAVRVPALLVARAMQEHPPLGNHFARVAQARDEVLRRSGVQAAERASRTETAPDTDI